jgi:O-antigen ligase
VGIAAALAALVLTLSRGGLIALFIILCAGAVYGLRTKVRSLWLSAGISVVLLLAFAALTIVWNPTVGLRLSTETEQTWYRAQYTAPDQLEAKPGEVMLVPVRVINTSVRRWDSGGDQPFMLGYHLLDSAGATVTYDGARTRLPHDLAPGEELVLDAEVHAPESAETYTIQWDMVQEAVSWFSWKGTPIAETALVVLGEPVQAATIPELPAPTDLTITRPTAERRELWLAALKMAADRPILGVGPDNFRWRYGDYTGLDAWNTNIHANNLYLEWLADTGIPGLLLFLVASWNILRAASRGLHVSANPVQAAYRLGLLGSLMAWYLHGMVDYFYEFTPTFVVFWMIVGLSLRIAEEET